jgi:hypothetical protein
MEQNMADNVLIIGINRRLRSVFLSAFGLPMADTRVIGSYAREWL